MTWYQNKLNFLVVFDSPCNVAVGLDPCRTFRDMDCERFTDRKRICSSSVLKDTYVILTSSNILNVILKKGI